MLKNMTVISRNPWATLWHGIKKGPDWQNPAQDLYAVQTIDDKDNQDFLHYHDKAKCIALFKRQISLEEFYR